MKPPWSWLKVREKPNMCHMTCKRERQRDAKIDQIPPPYNCRDVNEGCSLSLSHTCSTASPANTCTKTLMTLFTRNNPASKKASPGIMVRTNTVEASKKERVSQQLHRTKKEEKKQQNAPTPRWYRPCRGRQGKRFPWRREDEESPDDRASVSCCSPTPCCDRAERQKRQLLEARHEELKGDGGSSPNTLQTRSKHVQESPAKCT